MKNPPVLYPFLFALFPVLALFSFNITQVPTNQIVIPMGVILFSTLLLWAVLSFIFKDKKKGGLLTFFFLFLFFAYGHFHKGLVLQGFEIGQHRYLLSMWGILLALGVYLITKTRSSLHNHTLILNFVTAFLIISSLVRIVPYELKRRSTEKTVFQARNTANLDMQTHGAAAETTVATPDIYYIIFDRYANSTVLKESFAYDNSNFIDYLTEKGFFVASESRANYPSTLLSLASSLNLEYPDYLRAIDESDDHTVIYNMLHDYRVWRFLKRRGYKFIHFGDWWDPTRTNPLADMNFNYNPLGSNGFSIMLLQTTALDPLAEIFIGDVNTQNRQRALYKFQKLADIPEIEGPKFVFAHMLMPHDPYVFDSHGEPLTEEEVATRSEVENYVNQLIFTNEQIKLLIDEILSKSDSPPIIIIQSDEGPLITPEFTSAKFLTRKDWSQISPEALKTHIKILNAYYLPNFDQEDILYESISPVNSFRLVFNFYFGTDYELLEDKSYISKGSNRLYNFIEATDILSE